METTFMEDIANAQKLAKDIFNKKKMSTCPDEGLEDGLTISTADQDVNDDIDHVDTNGLGKGRTDSEVLKGERIDSESLSDDSISSINVEEDKIKSPGSVMDKEGVPDVPM